MMKTTLIWLMGLAAGYFIGASVAMHVWQPAALVRLQAESAYLQQQVQELNEATGRTPRGLREGLQWGDKKLPEVKNRKK